MVCFELLIFVKQMEQRSFYAGTGYFYDISESCRWFVKETNKLKHNCEVIRILTL
jgi:hypothetical protein